MGSHLDWSALVVIEQDIIAILILTNAIFVFVCISSAEHEVMTEVGRYWKLTF